jgi:transcriptional regulator with XRE-family HTH domain
MEKFNFGANLRRIRVQKEISQEAMAYKMNIGQTKYSRIERGKLLPDKEFIALAAEILGVPPNELMPAGWDKVTMACSLTRSGMIAYRLLLASAAYDMTIGFCDGADIESDLSKTAVASFFGTVAVIFHYYTEKEVRRD